MITDKELLDNGWKSQQDPAHGFIWLKNGNDYLQCCSELNGKKVSDRKFRIWYLKDHWLHKLLAWLAGADQVYCLLPHKKDKPKPPHKHTWKVLRTIGFGTWESYDVVECITCESKGRSQNGKIKVTERSEKAKHLPHECDWVFECRAGRPAGADKNTPMSEIYSCECGKSAVRHYGQVEMIILKQ